MDKVFNKLMKRLGFKDQYGWEETSLIGFIVLWSLFGYGAYLAIMDLIN